jgi:hypothetical protein
MEVQRQSDENRALRRLFELKREEVTRDSRRMHNDELVTYTLHQT